MNWIRLSRASLCLEWIKPQDLKERFHLESILYNLLQFMNSAVRTPEGMWVSDLFFRCYKPEEAALRGIHLSLHQLDGGQSSVRTWLWVDSCLWSPWTTQNQGQAGWPLCNGHFVCSKYSRHSGHNFSLNTFFGALCIWFSTTTFSVLILAVVNTKILVLVMCHIKRLNVCIISHINTQFWCCGCFF